MHAGCFGYVGFVRTDFVCGKQEIHWDQGWLTKKVWALTLTRFPSMRTARAKEQVFAIKWKLLCINYTFWSFEMATYTQMYTYLINNKSFVHKTWKSIKTESSEEPDVSRCFSDLYNLWNWVFKCFNNIHTEPNL